MLPKCYLNINKKLIWKQKENQMLPNCYAKVMCGLSGQPISQIFHISAVKYFLTRFVVEILA